MRTLSAAKAKGSKGRRLGAPLQLAPRQGTNIRRLYDFLLVNRGLLLHTTFNDAEGRAVRYLRDFYGFDIRCIKHGEWIFVGEWIGDRYIDYVAALQKEMDP
jgi:hypothetical protein